jgi:hypothetical protein
VIVKIVTLFLIGMGVLAMFGRLRMPESLRQIGRKTGLPGRPTKCRRCGAPRVGKGPCPCGEA